MAEDDVPVSILSEEFELIELARKLNALTPAQRTAMRQYQKILAGKAARARGGQVKLDNRAAVILLSVYARFRLNGHTRASILEAMAKVHHVEVETIEERIRLARHRVRAGDLPDWARGALKPRWKPPTNRNDSGG